MVVSHAIQLAIRAGEMMVLGRILGPRPFSVFAMALVLTEFANTFRDFGLPQATIQRTAINHQQLSGLFWTNVKLNGLLAAFLVLMAPLAAWFFDQPILAATIPILMIGMVASGLANLHVGLLRRQMRFGTMAVMGITGLSAGAIVGIVLAAYGAGFWALVAQNFAILLVRAMFPWLACTWRPAGPSQSHRPSEQTVRAMLSYGHNVALSRVVAFLGHRIAHILAGRMSGAGILGLYQKANQWAALPVLQAFLPVQFVAVASLSRLQHDVPTYRGFMRRATIALYGLSLPALTFLFVEAHNVILVLFGDKWVEAIPIFKALLLASFFNAAHMATSWVYGSEGRTDRQLRWTLVATPVVVAAVIIGAAWGALGMAIGYALAAILLLIPAVQFCLVASPLRFRDFWSPWIRAAAASLVAGAVLHIIRPWLVVEAWIVLRLILSALVFSLCYTAGWLLTTQGRNDVREVVHRFGALWS